jgi:DNA modification methylase
LFTTTLWEYPSQHYDSWVDDEGNVVRSKNAGKGPAMQGDKSYAGATPSWVIWQLLMRYTRPGDLVVDPMCGSGTTIDVCRDLDRRVLGYDVAPSRPDIFRADARTIPLEDAKADFVFLDPPYGTNIHYSDDPRCIGTLDVHGPDHGRGFYDAMDRVVGEIHRVLKNRRFFGLYVCDSYQKRSEREENREKREENSGDVKRNREQRKEIGVGGREVAVDAKGSRREPGHGMPRAFAPIGFELLEIMQRRFVPMDVVTVVRRNQKLQRGNWRKAAEEGNFFLRGFNYLFIMKKQD